MRMRSLSPILGAALLVVGAAISCAPHPSTSLHQLQGETMGTTWQVKLVAEASPGNGIGDLPAQIQGELDDVNAKMSHYREDSEVSTFNRWPSTEPFAISAATYEVLRLARDIYRTTGGAFDITIAPLVNAWGFGPPGSPPNPPAEEEIDDLLTHTGSEFLQLDGENSTISKSIAELTIDLSAIAKGYAVDRVAAALLREGYTDFMVEVGGEVRTRGLNHRGEAWRIGIERPGPLGEALQRIVPLKNLAMATSGDYRNYYELGGRRISHMIDPRTGFPITHRLSSVTVIDKSCARADALATALLVLGPDGLAMAEVEGWAVYALARNVDGSFEELQTPSFRALVEDDSD